MYKSTNTNDEIQIKIHKNIKYKYNAAIYLQEGKL